MERALSKRLTWAAVGLVAAVGLAYLVVGWQYRIWTLRDYDLYRTLRESPVGLDLWYGRIAAGQSFGELTARSPPAWVDQFGPYEVANYRPGPPPTEPGIDFAGIAIVARDGRLVAAYLWGETDSENETFFDVMGTREELEFHREYRAYLESRGR